MIKDREDLPGYIRRILQPLEEAVKVIGSMAVDSGFKGSSDDYSVNISDKAKEKASGNNGHSSG